MDPVVAASFSVLLLVVGATATFWWRVAHRDGGIAASALAFGSGPVTALGTRLAITAIGVARGDYAAWRNGVMAVVVLLTVTLPLAPLDGFAVGLSFFAFIGLASLLAVTRRVGRPEIEKVSKVLQPSKRLS